MILLVLLVTPLMGFNLLEANPECKNKTLIGLCRAHWAYTISDIVTM